MNLITARHHGRRSHSQPTRTPPPRSNRKRGPPRQSPKPGPQKHQANQPIPGEMSSLPDEVMNQIPPLISDSAKHTFKNRPQPRTRIRRRHRSRRLKRDHATGDRRRQPNPHPPKPHRPRPHKKDGPHPNPTSLPPRPSRNLSDLCALFFALPVERPTPRDNSALPA